MVVVTPIARQVVPQSFEQGIHKSPVDHQTDTPVFCSALKQGMGYLDSPSVAQVQLFVAFVPPAILANFSGQDIVGELRQNLTPALSWKTLYAAFFSVVEEKSPLFVDIDPYFGRNPQGPTNRLGGLQGADHGTAVELVYIGPTVLPLR